jgi:hypothetical protein
LKVANRKKAEAKLDANDTERCAFDVDDRDRLAGSAPDAIWPTSCHEPNQSSRQRSADANMVGRWAATRRPEVPTPKRTRREREWDERRRDGIYLEHVETVDEAETAVGEPKNRK